MMRRLSHQGMTEHWSKTCAEPAILAFLGFIPVHVVFGACNCFARRCSYTRKFSSGDLEQSYRRFDSPRKVGSSPTLEVAIAGITGLLSVPRGQYPFCLPRIDQCKASPLSVVVQQGK